MIVRNELIDLCAMLHRVVERSWPGRAVVPTLTWHFETLADAIDAMAEIEGAFAPYASGTRNGSTFKVAGVPMRITWGDKK